MPSRPTDKTFAAILSAIAAMEADPTAPRTKAHLMRQADVAHPTVHRAFRWDEEHQTPFKINERWNALTVGSKTRRSPVRLEQAEVESQLKAARELMLAADSETAGRIAYDLLQVLYAGADLSVLVPLLRSADGVVLDASAWVASELGAVAAPLLTELETVLRRGSRKARFWALDAINSSARENNGEIIGVALSLVNDTDPVIREKAADFMSRASDKQLHAASQSPTVSAPMHDLIRWFLQFREDVGPTTIRHALGSEKLSYRLATAAAAIRSGTRSNIEVLLESRDISVTALAERELAMPRWREGRR